MTNFFRDNGLISKDIITDAILRGKLFYLESFQTVNNGANRDFGLECPPDVEVKLFFHVSSTSRIELTRFTDSDFSRGEPEPVNNANENSGKLASLRIKYLPNTIPDLGRILWRKSQGFSASINQGANLSSEYFTVLKANTKHIIRITSRYTNNIVSYKLFWIEN